MKQLNLQKHFSDKMETAIGIEQKIQKNIAVSPTEKDIYCEYKLSQIEDIHRLPCECEFYKFQRIYRRYMQDLSFSSRYPKVDFSKLDIAKKYLNYPPKLKEQAYWDIGFKVEIDRAEVLRDKQYLFNVASQWNETISDLKHSDQKLKIASEETRKIKKEIRKKYKKVGADDEVKNDELRRNLWKTKYIYLEAIKVADTVQFPVELELKNIKIYYTFYSLFHIMNRHFAHLVAPKLHQKNKSYFSIQFHYNSFQIYLREIFTLFNNCDEFQEEIANDKKYNFRYKGEYFELYFKPYGQNKQLLQVSTLFPLEDDNERQKLQDMKLVELSEDLSFYTSRH